MTRYCVRAYSSSVLNELRIINDKYQARFYGGHWATVSDRSGRNLIWKDDKEEAKAVAREMPTGNGLAFMVDDDVQ